MRCPHGVAAHLAQHGQTEALQAVGQRGADTGVIVMVAGALNLQRLAVEEKALVGVKLHSADAKTDALGIARFASAFNGHNGRVEIRLIDGPERRIGQLSGGREVRASIHRNRLRGSLCLGHGLACGVQNLPTHLGGFGLFALIEHLRIQGQSG